MYNVSTISTLMYWMFKYQLWWKNKRCKIMSSYNACRYWASVVNYLTSWFVDSIDDHREGCRPRRPTRNWPRIWSRSSRPFSNRCRTPPSKKERKSAWIALSLRNRSRRCPAIFRHFLLMFTTSPFFYLDTFNTNIL